MKQAGIVKDVDMKKNAFGILQPQARQAGKDMCYNTSVEGMYKKGTPPLRKGHSMVRGIYGGTN